MLSEVNPLVLISFDEVMKVAIASTQFSEIDPKNENIVETARIQNLVVAPSEVIRMRGGDPEEVRGHGLPKILKQC